MRSLATIASILVFAACFGSAPEDVIFYRVTCPDGKPSDDFKTDAAACRLN